MSPSLIVHPGENLVLNLGGDHNVEIKAWPPEHTDHDLTVFDKKNSVFWAGDLLFVNHVPVLEANIKGFLEVIRNLKKLKIATYVPGHGTAGSDWPTPILAQERYMMKILTETRAAIKNGIRLMDGVHTIAWSEEYSWVRFKDFHRRNVTTAWTEHEWE